MTGDIWSQHVRLTGAGEKAITAAKQIGERKRILHDAKHISSRDPG